MSQFLFQAWNNFLNSSEEEQEAIIREGRGWRGEKKTTAVAGKSSTDNAERLSNDNWEEIPDSRAGMLTSYRMAGECPLKLYLQSDLPCVAMSLATLWEGSG